MFGALARASVIERCGYGRSGKFFAHQWLDVQPDIITVAKGIANGFPMGAVLISPKFEAVYGQLGTTFGGNHLACAAAMAVLDVIEGEGLIENAQRVGEHLMEGLAALQQSHAEKDNTIQMSIRGRGLMIGIELNVPYKEVRQSLLMDEHVFTGCAGTNVIRLLPPLCLSIDEADEFLDKFQKITDKRS